MFTFRDTLTLTDIQRIKAILTASEFFTSEEVQIATELAKDQLQKGEQSDYQFLLVEQDRHLLGYACYGFIGGTQSSYDIYWIAIDPLFRHRHMGTHLLKEVENCIRLKGGTKIYIETAGRSLYFPTQAFYKKNDYLLEATLKDFYSPGDDKLIFVKSLESQGD